MRPGLMIILAALAALTYQSALAQVERAYLFSSGIWKTRMIPVCWESNGYGREKEIVKSAVNESWGRESALRFVGWGDCSPSSVGVRIEIADTVAHVKFLGSLINGVKSGMVLNFTFNSWNQTCASAKDYCIRVIAVHEFGHALAFAHEHNRPDTPAWCRLEHSPQGSNGDVIRGRWDNDSVMNYCNPSYSNNGVLSAEDTDALRRYYGSPAFGSDAKGEALLAAAWRGDLDGVRRNLTPETFKSTSPEGLNALMMAADRCNIDMALFLLNSGVLSAFDVNRRNAWKNTALEIARGTPKEKRDQGLDEPRCIALAPILQSFGGQ